MDTDTRERDPDGTTADDGAAPPEGGAWTRFGISAFIVVTLLAVLACTMPASTLRNELLTRMTPYLDVTGLDQGWGVFSPSVRPMSIYVDARVDQADGTSATYELPYSTGLPAYWDYRWQKYGEQVFGGAATDRERFALAVWMADRDRAAGGRPVRVTLLARVVPNLPPGPGADTGPSTATPFYTARVGAA